MAPNILIDWKADQENRFTVPIGLGIGKLVKIGPLPVKFTAEVDYMAIHPDDFGQHWGGAFPGDTGAPGIVQGHLVLTSSG